MEGADPFPGALVPRGGERSAGNGGSGSPTTSEGYEDRRMIDDAWAVLDAVGAAQAVLVGLCTGVGLCRPHGGGGASDRVLGICAINPGLQLSAPLPHKVEFDFDEPRDSYEGWQKMNRHYWLEDWPDFAQFFFDEMSPSSYSTKQLEDCVEWAMQDHPRSHDPGPLLRAIPGERARDRCGGGGRPMSRARHHRLAGHVPESRAQHPARRDHREATTSSSRAAGTFRRHAIRSR